MTNNKDAFWLPYMARARNYNKWVFDQYKDYVGDSAIDLGSGFGTFVDFIKEKKSISLIEISDEAIDRLKYKYKNHNNIKIIKHDLSKSAPLQFQSAMDTAICLNVLEHVKDDESMIKNIRQCLEHKGKLILYVPAVKALFGSLDSNLGHYRRYKKAELEQMLGRNGFKIIKSRYMNFLGAFTWFLYSRILKRDKVKEKRILFYDKWFIPLISRIENLINPPIGQSLLIIAEAN